MKLNNLQNSQQNLQLKKAGRDSKVQHEQVDDKPIQKSSSDTKVKGNTVTTIINGKPITIKVTPEFGGGGQPWYQPTGGTVTVTVKF